LDYSNVPADELAHNCLRSGDQAAWTEFVRRFQPLIASVIIRIARQWGVTSSQVVDDLVQETFLKLCADRDVFIRNFRPVREGAVFGYIKVFTANLVHDHFKVAHSQKRGGMATPAPIDGEDGAQSSSTAEHLERAILLKEIDACLRGFSVGPTSARDRKIFWLYYRVGLTADAIAMLPKIGLTTKGVESTLRRLAGQVREKLATGHPSSPPRRHEGIHSRESL
jgi:RNA polymerase sigma factor (sigma-70 family)